MARWKHRPEGSNWGDFGPDDQLGRINLLTPERRREGLAEAKEGIAFTLSLPLDYPGGNFVQFRAPPVLLASHSRRSALQSFTKLAMVTTPMVSWGLPPSLRRSWQLSLRGVCRSTSSPKGSRNLAIWGQSYALPMRLASLVSSSAIARRISGIRMLSAPVKAPSALSPSPSPRRQRCWIGSASATYRSW